MMHHCITCKREREGRFTRVKSGARGSWTKGSLPAWHCWACLPPGQGNDEDEETAMAKKPAAAKIIDVGATSALPLPQVGRTLLADKREGLALQGPLQKAVEELGEIETPEDYLKADGIFGRIRQARKVWNLKMYGTKEKPGPIPGLRTVLDQLYALNREVDKPLEHMETAVEEAMKTFKREERRQLLAAEEERLTKEQRAREEVARLAERKEAVKTPAAKARIEEAIEEAEQTLVETQTEAQPEATRGANSSDRLKKVPVVKDFMTFAKGVTDGIIPEDCLLGVNMVKLRAYYKTDPEAVIMFPGVVIEDDIQIVGRS